MRAIDDAGSSPLARGTPPPGGAGRREHRFIPARAGNTAPAPARWRSGSVHPRSRGEHPVTTGRSARTIGSSPLARGTPRLRSADDPSRRFIPARAGNTGPGPRPSGSTAVHPRSRGEHQPRLPVISGYGGSSPLARGTRPPPIHTRSETRFIPARAGNTGRPGSGAGAGAVHPRSRGEHVVLDDVASNGPGSSPLARGTHFPELIDRLDFFRCQRTHQRFYPQFRRP